MPPPTPHTTATTPMALFQINCCGSYLFRNAHSFLAFLCFHTGEFDTEIPLYVAVNKDFSQMQTIPAACIQ